MLQHWLPKVIAVTAAVHIYFIGFGVHTFLNSKLTVSKVFFGVAWTTGSFRDIPRPSYFKFSYVLNSLRYCEVSDTKFKYDVVK